MSYSVYYLLTFLVLQAKMFRSKETRLWCKLLSVWNEWYENQPVSCQNFKKLKNYRTFDNNDEKQCKVRKKRQKKNV